MNKLTFGDVSKTHSELPTKASDSLYRTASFNLPHKSEALVERFVRFSSFTFFTPALPQSLFYVKQSHKK